MLSLFVPNGMAAMDYDCHQAKRLLYARRSLLHDENSGFCFCPPSSSSADFTYQEVNHVLTEVVDTDGPLGVIKSLLSLGADVNFDLRPGRSPGLWGRITQARQAGIRCDVLLRASLRCQPDKIRVIAALADHQNIEVVFRQAVLRKDFLALQALLSHDGQARPCPASLDAALGKALEIMGGPDASMGQDIIQRCLAAGSSGPETDFLMTEGIVRAVQSRNNNLLDTIMSARPARDSVTMALVEAVRGRQINLLLRLIKFPQSTTSLTAAVSEAIKIKDSPLRYEIVRLLVGVGATESCTAEALVQLVQEIVLDERATAPEDDAGNRLLVFLLDQGMADVDYKNAEALQLAVKAGRLDIAQEIVSRQPSSDSLGSALPWAMQMTDKRSRRHMVELLLRHQINEQAVCRALVDAVKDGGSTGNRNLVKLLLTRASVNYNNGEVFIYAIRQNRLDVLHLFLDQGTSYKTLFTAVREALVASTSQRRVIFGILLRHMEVDHFNEVLKHLILEGDTDLCLVGVVLQAGAEPLFDNGVCIKNAAYRLDRNALRILTEHCGRNVTIFGQALSVVLNRGRQWISYEHVEVLQLLLRCGASAQIEVVSKAMTEVVDHLAGQEKSAELAITLLEILFSSGAQLDYEDGKAMKTARGRSDSDILSHLLRYEKPAMSKTQQEKPSVDRVVSDEQPELFYRLDRDGDDNTTTLVSSQNTQTTGIGLEQEKEKRTEEPQGGYAQAIPGAVMSRPRGPSVKIRPYGAPYFTQTLACVDEKSFEAGVEVHMKTLFDSEKMPVVSVTEVEVASPLLVPAKGFRRCQRAVPLRPVQERPASMRHPGFSGFRKARQYGWGWRLDTTIHDDDQKIAETEVIEILQGDENARRRIGRPEMTEVKTKRGQVIGHVDLSELRRWQRQNSL